MHKKQHLEIASTLTQKDPVTKDVVVDTIEKGAKAKKSAKQVKKHKQRKKKSKV